MTKHPLLQSASAGRRDGGVALRRPAQLLTWGRRRLWGATRGTRGGGWPETPWNEHRRKPQCTPVRGPAGESGGAATPLLSPAHRPDGDPVRPLPVPGPLQR